MRRACRDQHVSLAPDVRHARHHWPNQGVMEGIKGATHPCFRAGRGEESFESMLAAKGFTGMHISEDLLHEEYREGAYKILRASKL